MYEQDEYAYNRAVVKEYGKVAQLLSHLYKNTANTEAISREYLEEFLSMQKFQFTNSKHLYMLFDHVRFLPIYLSENVRVTGFSPEDYYKMNLLQAFRLVYWKQITSVYRMHVWGRDFGKLTKFSPIKNHETLICGAKLKDKWGKVRIYFCRQKFLSSNKKGHPTLSLLLGEEITSIFKGERGWIKKIDYSSKIPIQRVYFGDGNTKYDLLSERELAILKLVIKDMDSTAIAKQLGISTETVKRHRKNMIAKVGAKDMTALIYLCQQANVI